ncbi:nucleoside deaminase [Propylenella binzhouense]|uniref:Nucleoside deaminase n=1 Tax=Propylenella binzhouense TaxID=2555902 RepID=A0A964WS41_9HYPH|nr:nucleoside deaminase [Propylenella binzhouense]MYZ46445.1 nucleoside deaminase [Propylenella binzhouense]
MPPEAGARAARLLSVIEAEIVPLTRAGVAAGNKIFGAAVLRKADLSLVVAGTNRETANPLWHGEIATLDAFFALPQSSRPAPGDCVFLSTHEPCPLCLSAITWAGFDNFTYLFGYADTRDAFAIPHDLRILEEVFGVRDGAYRRQNAYWTASSIADLVGNAPEPERRGLNARVAALAHVYSVLSEAYHAGKGAAGIPLD